MGGKSRVGRKVKICILNNKQSVQHHTLWFMTFKFLLGQTNTSSTFTENGLFLDKRTSCSVDDSGSEDVCHSNDTLQPEMVVKGFHPVIG